MEIYANEKCYRKRRRNVIKLLYDDIAIDNTAVKMFLKNGFIEEYKTSDKNKL